MHWRGDERVSGSGSGDASEMGVEGRSFGTFARSATGAATNASAVAEAATLPTVVEGRSLGFEHR